jgi:mannosyl-3-phosphoglycerate phosphatase
MTSNRWVVSDLDGTLLNHHYDWSAAASTINWLQQQSIPVIPCTSKTAEEVRLFRQEAGLHDPFIVENGGAIHGDDGHGGEWMLAIGKPHGELRPLLDQLAKELGSPLPALEDLTAAEGDSLTGLRGEALSRAQRRQWSVPFITPAQELRNRLRDLASALGLQVVQGNRMSHLLSAGSHKGRALQELKKHLHQSDVEVLGLGDSPNDLPLLEAVDQAVVVPGPDGPHPVFADAIANGHYQLAPAPHAEGWALAVRQWLGP